MSSLDDPDDFARSFWRTPVDLATTQGALNPENLNIEFAAMAENMPTLGWIARADGYIVWYNRRWHDYCGTAPAEMEGWGWRSVHDPDRLADVMERWSSAIATGEPFEMVFPLRGADGIFRPFLTRAAPVRDATGAVVRWFGINTEVGAQIAAEDALSESEANFAILTDAMPQMVWSTLPDGYHDYYNAQWYAFTGVPAGSTDGEGWNDMFHPEDQERAWARWRSSLETGKPYEIEYRLKHHSGEYRWTLGRALPVRSADGTITRWIGTCTDIDAAKRDAEQNALLSRELSHRIKNIFAIISGLINLSGRNSPELRPALAEVTERIGALGRAHDFARPHSPQSAPQQGGGTLSGIIEQVLLPYQLSQRDRITVAGDDIEIDDRGATPIALVVHELATNAAKYGALSDERGHVRITIDRDGDDLTIDWVEEGGPELTGPPRSRGFGTELAELSVERQLGGTIRKEWAKAGLRVRIAIQCSRLHRSSDAAHAAVRRT